jgi:hypothetical protein
MIVRHPLVAPVSVTKRRKVSKIQSLVHQSSMMIMIQTFGAEEVLSTPSRFAEK